MTAKRPSCVLSTVALLLLGGATRAQYPSASQPYDPFGRPAAGPFRSGVPGRPSGPWTGVGPGQHGIPSPVAYGNQLGGYPGAVRPGSYPRNPVLPGRPTRDDRDRSAVSPEVAGRLAEGAVSGLSHVGHSGGTPRPTLRETPHLPTGVKGGSWWKRATSSGGRGWLAGIGAGIAAAFGALFGRRKQGAGPQAAG